MGLEQIPCNQCRMLTSTHTSFLPSIVDGPRVCLFRLKSQEGTETLLKVAQAGVEHVFSNLPVQVQAIRNEVTLFNTLIPIEQIEQMDRHAALYVLVMDIYKPWLKRNSEAQQLKDMFNKVKFLTAHTEKVITRSQTIRNQPMFLFADIQASGDLDRAERQAMIAQSDAEVKAMIAQSDAEVKAMIAQSSAEVKAMIAQSSAEVKAMIAQSSAEVKAMIAQSSAEVKAMIAQAEVKVKIVRLVKTIEWVALAKLVAVATFFFHCAPTIQSLSFQLVKRKRSMERISFHYPHSTKHPPLFTRIFLIIARLLPIFRIFSTVTRTLKERAVFRSPRHIPMLESQMLLEKRGGGVRLSSRQTLAGLKNQKGTSNRQGERPKLLAKL